MLGKDPAGAVQTRRLNNTSVYLKECQLIQFTLTICVMQCILPHVRIGGGNGMPQSSCMLDTW